MAVIVVAALFWVFTWRRPTWSAPARRRRPGRRRAEPGRPAATNSTDAGLEPTKVEKADEDVAAGDHHRHGPDRRARGQPRGRRSQVRVSAGPAQVTLPDLAFTTEDDAQGDDRALGLVYGIDGAELLAERSGRSRSSASGPRVEDLVTTAVQVEQGSTVDLVVSNGLVQRARRHRPADHRGAVDLSGSALQLTVKVDPTTGCTGQTVTAQSLMGESRRSRRSPSGTAPADRRPIASDQLSLTSGLSVDRALGRLGEPGRGEPVAEHPVAALGEHRLGVELHAEERAPRGGAGP